MKKAIIGFAVMVMAVAAQAQDHKSIDSSERHHGRKKQHGHEMMTTKLNLTAQQQEQLKKLNADFHSKQQDLRKSDAITMGEFRKQSMELRKQQQSAFQAILTNEQKDQLAKLKAERKDRMKSHGVTANKKLQEKLKLTDEQASKLKTMHESMAAKMQAIRSDNSLSTEQKHEQFKALSLQRKEEMKSVLTAEQLQQMQQLKQRHTRRDFTK